MAIGRSHVNINHLTDREIRLLFFGPWFDSDGTFSNVASINRLWQPLFIETLVSNSKQGEMNSVCHNLSMDAAFEKVPSDSSRSAKEGGTNLGCVDDVWPLARNIVFQSTSEVMLDF